MDISSLSSIVEHWPMDWIFIAALAVFTALDTMRTGSARAAALVLSLPASLLVLSQLPKAFFVGPLFAQFEFSFAPLMIFISVALFLYIATHRLIFTFSNNLGPIQSLMVGCAAAAVLVVVWLQVPELDTVWRFGEQVQTVFGEAYRFWWLVGSYVVLAAVRD